MGSAAKSLEKQVDEANREIKHLNERIGVIEQEMNVMKEFMKEALVQGKWPVNQGSLVQIANAIGSGMGSEKTVCKGFESDKSNLELPRGSFMSKIVSKPKEMGGAGREEGGLDEICEQEETEKEVKQEIVTGGAHQFKFLGKIGSREVIVLVGLAATHNFISRKLVNALQIPLERTSSFRVNFGCGPQAEGAEVCKRVVLKMHGIEIVERFFPTDLVIADVVLGNEWVRSLGEATLQGIPMTLTFKWHGRTVSLQADPSLSKRNETGLMMLEWI